VKQLNHILIVLAQTVHAKTPAKVVAANTETIAQI